MGIQGRQEVRKLAIKLSRTGRGGNLKTLKDRKKSRSKSLVELVGSISCSVDSLLANSPARYSGRPMKASALLRTGVLISVDSLDCLVVTRARVPAPKSSCSGGILGASHCIVSNADVCLCARLLGTGLLDPVLL
jgi:hypothetical protein